MSVGGDSIGRSVQVLAPANSPAKLALGKQGSCDVIETAVPAKTARITGIDSVMDWQATIDKWRQTSNSPASKAMGRY